ncbi:MAG: 4'-phosphopantetheinyl transferase superfamily protein [Lachnospiraceae bacterium]|nr:4'-phosphopantetheinyl transferase superfamily protein [Lachnospiraceae bacterium]
MKLKFYNITELSEQQYEKYYQKVSPSCRERADRFRQKADAYRHVMGEVLLFSCMEEVLGKVPVDKIERNEYGKPYVKGSDDFFFNISHSGDYVVVVCHNEPVGVDIQEMRTISPAMVKKIFTKEEVTYLASLSEKERERHKIMLWSMKESYIKYLGLGLSREMDTFFVDAKRGKAVDMKDCPPKEAEIFVTLWKENYYLSICTKNPWDQDEIRRQMGI